MQLMSLLVVMDLRVTRTGRSWHFMLELIRLKKPMYSMSLQALLLPLPATQIRQQQICWCIVKHCRVSSIAKDGFGW
jgi:hypothetical protein